MPQEEENQMGFRDKAREVRAIPTGKCTKCHRSRGACVCHDDRRALRSAMSAACSGCGFTRCKCRRKR